MERNVTDQRALKSLTIINNRTDIKEVVFKFVLTGGKVIDRAVEPDSLIIINDDTTKYKKEVNVRGDSIFIALNKHNIREYEVEEIIKYTTEVRSVEDGSLKETLKKHNSELIYSKHEIENK